MKKYKSYIFFILPLLSIAALAVFAWNGRMGIHVPGWALILCTATGILSIFFLIVVNSSIKKEMVPFKESHETSGSGIETVSSFEKDLNLSKLVYGLQDKTVLEEFGKKIIKNLEAEFEIVQALFYVRDPEGKFFHLRASYAANSDFNQESFEINQGLNGQAASTGQPLFISNVPDDYRKIQSGLGSSKPTHICILPIRNENASIALLEFSSFKDGIENKKDVLQLFSLKAGELLTKITGK